MLQVVWVSFMFEDTQEQGNGQGKGGVIPWKQIRKKLVLKAGEGWGDSMETDQEEACF